MQARNQRMPRLLYGTQIMGQMKRAAVLAGQCDEEYQNGFLRGFLAEAFARDFEVCIFSMNRKYMDTHVREVSEAQIFDLFVPDDYDAIVILRDSIQTPGVGDALEERIHESFTGPVLVIDLKSKYFPSILTDSSEPCYRLVSHLIEHHGFTDIAYLTGKRWHEHAIMRLDAYKKAMEDHGLPIYEDRIIYGDFWYTSGEVAANSLIDGRGLPQAVACANDQMAIGLCKALEKRGFKVGKDIAVVGFDSCEDGRKSPRPLTSCILPAKENGIYAARYIDDSLAGREITEYKEDAAFFIGESCGCKCSMLTDEKSIRSSLLRNVWDTEISKEGFGSVYNNMMNDLLNETELPTFLNTVYSYVYQLGNVDSFSLCLCGHWKDMDLDPDVVSDEAGITSKVILAVSYGREEAQNYTGTSEIFDRRVLLPQLEKRGTVPRAFFFTPLYSENRCFGYGAVSYGDQPRTYDRTYCKWMNLVGIGLEGLRRTSMIRLLEKNSQIITAKYSGGADNILLSPDEKAEYDLTKKILDENLFSYHFQPIIDVNERNIYSYEALMRSGTETKLSPIKMLKYAGLMGRLEDVEKLTFINVLSRLDDPKDEFKDKKIFINSIPGVKLSDDAQAQVDKLLKKHSASVIVEYTEEAQLDDNELERLNEKYASMGIWTAIDDYGTGYSSISNLLRYMPKIVKIDRSLLSGIQDKPQKKHFVKDIIDFCHQNNMLALAEGVETSAELQMVVFLGADLIQGFYTARPSAQLLSDISPELKNEITKYVREREDGAIRYSYETGKTNRVTLSNLSRAGYTDIIVKGENVVYKDITVIGAPGQNTDIFVSVEDGYTGRLNFENVNFSGTNRYQCIELGKNVNLTIYLKGNNILRHGGILVPEGSKLTFEGEGSLEISLDRPGFGIGAGENERCGELIFDQDGEIKIISKGRRGVCIGAELGGMIDIKRGKYLLECGGSECVGVGFMSGDNHINISTCLLEVRLNAAKCCGVGSFDGNTDIFVTGSTVSITGGGLTTVCMGTLYGSKAVIGSKAAYFEQSIRSEDTVCLGAMFGRTEINLEESRVGLSANGNNALAFGGTSGDASVKIYHCDVSLVINNELGFMCASSPENVELTMNPGDNPILVLCGKPVTSLTS